MNFTHFLKYDKKKSFKYNKIIKYDLICLNN